MNTPFINLSNLSPVTQDILLLLAFLGLIYAWHTVVEE
jgi:hypothetical protein